MKMKVFCALISIFCITVFVSKMSYGENEDNGKIAFTANLSGNWDLFIVDEDGTNLIKLTKTSIDERAPAISPDRKWVVYSTTEGNLWLITIDGTLKTSVLMPAEGPCNNPCWTADGKAIFICLI